MLEFERIKKKCKYKITFQGKPYLQPCKYRVMEDYKVDLLDCAKNWQFQINSIVDPCGEGICNSCIEVKNGKLIISKGYVWNGADHVDYLFDRVLNVPNTQEATLIHDALCHAIREIDSNNSKARNTYLPDTLENQKCADEHLYHFLMAKDNFHTARIMHLAVRAYQKMKKSRLNSCITRRIAGILGGIIGLLIYDQIP
ncbi:MAG: hypothetical protein OXC68_14745 [Aestuariivita sp.]|nr:hypothetical protein [Aestuariivita sp.]